MLILLALVIGNSATASKLQTPRNIKLQGAVSGNANFDGSNNITITTTQANIAVISGAITDGSGNISVNYPAGYNKDNCVVISAMTKTKGYTLGTTFDTVSAARGSTTIAVSLLDSIQIRIKGIYLDSQNGVGVVENNSREYKIILMKIS